MENESLTLAQFWDRLNAHDWLYVMSDDHDVYRRGSAESQALATIADHYGGPYRDLYAKWCEYADAGSFTSETLPRPERPEEDE